jgi:hypothetical protein
MPRSRATDELWNEDLPGPFSPEELARLLEEDEEPWRRNRAMVKRGYGDLAYLPKSKTGWNATLAAQAYSQRQHHCKAADLNLWATMHGCPASARYAALADDALVLWHGTSRQRAERIREVGLFSKRGLWATAEPRIAHGYTRGRAGAFDAGSAMIVLLLDRGQIEEGLHYTNDHGNEQIFRFHSGLDSQHIAYILWADGIEFCGEERDRAWSPWGTARFKRQGGRWVPLSQPPVRLDGKREYHSFGEWLDLSVERILQTLGSATALEVFSSLYATLDPWDALEHEAILDHLDRVAEGKRLVGPRRFFPAHTTLDATSPD